MSCKKLIKTMMSMAIILSMIMPVFEIKTVMAAEKSVDIMFVSDVHSHLEPFNTVFEGEQTNIGGFARIKTLIEEQKENNPQTLLVDGGDYSMGTLYHTMFETNATELRMLGQLGIECTTLGNHEFDFGSEGLANMINTAVASGDYIPQTVICNIDWDNSKNTSGVKKLKTAFDSYNVQPYTVTEKNGVKIALIGVFGIDALNCAPTCELSFLNPVESVKNTVSLIKENEDVDMIVLISHSGLGSDATTDIDGTNLKTSGESEDEVMAKSVPELDLIISGHSHTTVKEPLKYGDTYIVGCGEYSEQLGNITMTLNDAGRWNIIQYELIPIISGISENETIKKQLEDAGKKIDTEYLSQFGYTRNQILATNDIVFDTWRDTYDNHTESILGDYLSDAFRTEASKALGEDVDIAVVPSGCIRDNIPLGDVTVNDVFTAYSLGKGPDGIVGYPLTKTYLSGEDIKLVVEVDTTLSDLMHSARLYISGMGFTYNPNRMILNKATDTWLIKGDEISELEDDKLYSIVIDQYTYQMISAVTNLTKGLLKLELKDENGNPVKNIEDFIIYEEDGTELKAWEAVAQYTESFEDNKVPEKYASWDGRKNVDKSFSSLFRNINKYAVAISALAIFAIAIVVFVICLIIKVIRKKITSQRFT